MNTWINKIHQGNCFDLLQELPDSSIDCIISDPPYEIGYDEWDTDFDIRKAIELCAKKIKLNGNIILFQGWSNVCKTKQIMDNYFNIQNWIIWDRIKGRGAKYNLVSTREDILWYCNGNKPTYNKMYSNIKKKTGGLGKKNGQENRALSNVWYDISPIVPWSKERVDHSAQKPVALIERCIKLFSNENDIILDFCAGSCTTAIACIKTNRNYICIEKEEKYCEIGNNRVAEIVGSRNA